MSNYNLEYKKYCKTALIFASFMTYLEFKRQEAAEKRNYKKVQYYDEIIQEEQEQTQCDGIELNNFND